MKLACVIHRFGPQITGGSEAHCLAIATQLAAAGHDVEILTSCATDYVTWANALPEGESREGALRVRRFPVTRPRHLNRFREISEWVFTGRATEAEQEQWFHENGPELPRLLDHLREHGSSYDRVLFWSFRYYPTFFGLPLVADRAILVPTAEDDEIIRTASILGAFFAKPRAYLFLTPEEQALVAARCTGPLPAAAVVGAGLNPSPPFPPSPPASVGERGDSGVGVGTPTPTPFPDSRNATLDQLDATHGQGTALDQPGAAHGQSAARDQPGAAHGQSAARDQPGAAHGQGAALDQLDATHGQGAALDQPGAAFGQNAALGWGEGVLEQLGIRGPFVLYLGRIEKNKGCDRLVDYFLSYAESGKPVIELVMAGPSIMEIPRHPAIRVLGFVSEQVRDGLLAGARVLVMPSPYESLSMVLLEAWRVGTPALVYGRCKPLRGQTERADGGLIYEQREEFVEALSWFVEQPEQARQFGRQGQAYVAREYQWPVVMGKIERILRV
jgi:hypothetical protein